MGAGIRAFIFSFSGVEPSQKPGALRVMLADFDAAGASEWELYAWTFDEDGLVIEDCITEAFSPSFEGVATDTVACNTAVGMLAYGLFTP